MSLLKTSHPLALNFLFSDELFLVNEKEVQQPVLPLKEVAQAEAIPVEVEEDIYFKYLGENNKYLLLLVNHPSFDIIDPKELEALINILQAKKLELRDVAILNYAKYPKVTFAKLKSFFALNKLVLFGVSPQQLQLPAISGNQITVHDNVKVLASYSFSEMQSDVNKKRLFWNEMKLL